MPIRFKACSLGAVTSNSAARIGASSADYQRGRAVWLISVFVFMVFPALAFAQVGHTCVAYCDGDPAPSRGGGGGYFAPAPSGPSPAQLAAIARRQRALAVNNEAIRYLKARNFSKALKLFRQALQLAPYDRVIKGNVQLTLGLLANEHGIQRFADGEYESAIREYDEALRLKPNDIVIKMNLLTAKAMIAEKENNLEAALAYVRQALRYKPNNKKALAQVSIVQADIAVAAGNNEQALKYAKQALRLLPNDKIAQAEVAILEGVAAADRGQYEPLLNAYRTRRDSRPNNKFFAACVPQFKGYIARKSGDWETARRYYREAAQIAPELKAPKAGIALAEAHFAAKAGKWNEAADDYRRALALADPISIKFKTTAAEVAQARADLALAEKNAAEQAKNGSGPSSAQVRGPTGFFGDKVTANPDLTPSPTGPHGSGPSAAAQATSALQSASTGATMDGSRGSVPGQGIAVFQKSASTPPPSLLPGVADAQLKKALDSTPQGRALLDNLTATANELQRTQAKIEMLRSAPNAATNPDYSKALIAQDQLLQKLTPLQKQAQQIVTKVVLDSPKDSAAPKPDIDHIAVPAPEYGRQQNR